MNEQQHMSFIRILKKFPNPQDMWDEFDPYSGDSFVMLGYDNFDLAIDSLGDVWKRHISDGVSKDKIYDGTAGKYTDSLPQFVRVLDNVLKTLGM